MSTILKALDRLEREKREPLARTLQQEVATPAAALAKHTRTSMRTPSLLAALAIGLGIGFGGFGLFLASRTPTASVAPALPAPEAEVGDDAWRIDAQPDEPAEHELVALGESAAADAAEDAIELDAEVVVTTTDGIEFVESEALLIDPALNARSESEDLPTVAVVAPLRSSPIEPQPAAEVAAAAEIAKSIAVKPAARKRAAKPKPERAVEAAPELAREIPESAPQAAAPSVAQVGVVSTVWHPSGERRHAIVKTRAGETREVREGDLVDGLLVDRIEPSRVVFSDGGMELVRRVGDRR